MSALSNTSQLTESATFSVSGTSSLSVSSSEQVTASQSLSQWDCNALNDTEVFIGLGNLTYEDANFTYTSAAAAAAQNGTASRFVHVAPDKPHSNPTTTPAALIRKSILTTAQRIDRHQLMDAPTPLVLNITVSSFFANMWSVGSATLAGQPLQWQVTKAVTGSWHLLTLQPPDNGWVGVGGLPIYFLDRVLVIEITMTCGYQPFLTMTIAAMSPRVPRDFAERVAVATKSVQVASIFAGGLSSGAALARVLTVRSMVVCDADTAVSGGVLDPGFLLCSSTSDPASDTARSAVASNLVLFGLVVVLLLALAAVWATVRSKPMREVLATLALPSSLMTVAMAVIPSSMSGAVLLAARYSSSSCGALDAVLIVAGLLASVAPLLFVVRLWSRKARGDAPAWVCALHPVELPPQDGKALTAVTSALRRGLHRSWKWSRAAQPSMGTPQSAQVLLLEYRVLWYPALDAAVLTAVALLTVVGGLNHENRALCRGTTAAVVVMLIAQCILIVTIQPFSTLFSLVVSTVTVGLTCISVVAQLVVVASSSSSLLWLANASVVCSVVILGISGARMCADAHDILFAVRKRIGVAGHVKQRKSVVEDGIYLQEDGRVTSADFLDDILGIDEFVNIDPPPPTTMSKSNHCSLLSAADAAVEEAVGAFFWDDSGNALGAHVTLAMHDEEPSILASMVL
jgi:hypothetical protein